MINSIHWPENNDFYIYAKEKGHGELIEKLGYNGRGAPAGLGGVRDSTAEGPFFSAQITANQMLEFLKS